MAQVPIETPAGAQAKADAAAATAAAGRQLADPDLTALANLSPTNDDIPQRKAGSWTNRTPTQFRVDLGLATVATSGSYGSLADLPDLSLKADLVVGKVPAVQLPSYVDDVLEFANLAGFPATGETGKIYTALDTGRIYRWSGSAYVEISPSPGSTDAVPEGAVNLYYTDGRAQTANAAALATKANSAAIVRGIPGRKLAALGDSITAGVIGASTPNANNVLQGSYLMYGCMQSGGRLEWGGQFGVPGETTQQILARVNAVIAAAPHACLVLTGTNDTTLPAYTTYLPQIVSALLAAGIEPILATCPPSSLAYSGNQGVHRPLRARNGWVTWYATQNGLRLVDFFTDLVDPVTGLYRTGHNSDVTHPNQVGYRVMGATLANAMSEQVRAGRSYVVTDSLDETAFTTNPLFLNGTTVPDGWNVAAAGTGVTTSFVSDDPNFLGRAYLTTCTGASTRAIQVGISNSDLNFQPGDRVSVSCKLTTAGLEAAGATATISVPNNSKTSGPTNVVSWQVGADIVGGRIYYESIVPPGTNGMSIQIRNDGGNGTGFSYRVGQFSVRSLDRLVGS